MPKPTKKRVKSTEHLVNENENAPTTEQWLQLYAMMDDIQKIAPWKYMHEGMIFGVQEPQTGMPCYVSVMGQLGEHVSIAVYLGHNTLHQFWAVSNKEVSPMTILELPSLQASFENRDQLSKDDIELVRQLGFRYRGAQKWPLFRRYGSGYFPWYLEQDEAQLLINVFRQAIPMFERIKQDMEILGRHDETEILFRLPIKGDKAEGEEPEWTDAYLEVPRDVEADPWKIIALDETKLEVMRQRPRHDAVLMVDFFVIPRPIEKGRHHRPYFPYCMLVVERESNFVAGHKITGVDEYDSFEQMLAEQPNLLLETMLNAQIYPNDVYVTETRLYEYLLPLCEELDIELSLWPSLPVLDDARDAFLHYMARQR